MDYAAGNLYLPIHLFGSLTMIAVLIYLGGFFLVEAYIINHIANHT